MGIEDLKQAQSLIAKYLAEMAPATPGGKRTDRRIEPIQTLPTASVMQDPAFGSTIRRVTSGPTGGPSWRTQSSSYGWSADSKRFVVIGSGGGVMEYSWGGKDAAPTLIGSLSMFGTEVCYDREVPGIIYGGAYESDVAVVRRFDPAKGFATIANVRKLVPTVDFGGRTFIRGVQEAAGRVVALFGGTGQDKDRYVYIGDALTGQPIVPVLDSGSRLGCFLHAIGIDLSGRYLVLGPTSEDVRVRHHPLNYVWDLQADSIVRMDTQAGGHGLIGSGFTVNNPDDADGMEYVMRQLASPNAVRELITTYPTPRAFSMASHLTYAKGAGTMASATYRYNEGIKAPWREWDNEIIDINPDTGVVRRWCHHRSEVSILTPNNPSAPTPAPYDFQYWSTPKPCISPDGQGIIFTSDWGRSLGTNGEGPRQDVFLVQAS